MGKRSEKLQSKQAAKHTKSVKKSRSRVQEPESDESLQSQFLEKEEPKTSKSQNKNKKNSQMQEQLTPKRPKTRSEDMVVSKIRKAFKQAEHQIIASAKEESSDEDQVSIDEDNELEEESSEITPLDEEEDEQSESASQLQFNKKNSKHSKKKNEAVIPGFHRKLQITYEIMDKKQDNKLSCEVDGKNESMNPEIMQSLSTIKKSIENIELLFRSSSTAKKEDLQPKVDSLIEKYAKNHTQTSNKDNSTINGSTGVDQHKKEDKMVDSHKKEKTADPKKQEKQKKRLSKKKRIQIE